MGHLLRSLVNCAQHVTHVSVIFLQIHKTTAVLPVPHLKGINPNGLFACSFAGFWAHLASTVFTRVTLESASHSSSRWAVVAFGRSLILSSLSRAISKMPMETPSKANQILRLVWRYTLSKAFLVLLLMYELVGMTLYMFSNGDIDVCIPCLWTTIFHVHCPGCGLTTATMSILKLNFAGAWEANPLVFVVVPAIIFYAAIDFLQFRKRYLMNARLA